MTSLSGISGRTEHLLAGMLVFKRVVKAVEVTKLVQQTLDDKKNCLLFEPEGYRKQNKKRVWQYNKPRASFIRWEGQRMHDDKCIGARETSM